MNETTTLSTAPQSIEADLPALFKLSEGLITTGFLPEAIKTPAQAVAIILAGRELGIGPMLALRSISIIKGKVIIAADLQLAQFKKMGGSAKFLELTETKASLHLRHSNGDEHTETFTIEDATRAGLVRAGGNWTTFPKAMLRSRAITAGLKSVGFEPTACAYDPDEARHFEQDPEAFQKQLEAEEAERERIREEDRARPFVPTATPVARAPYTPPTRSQEPILAPLIPSGPSDSQEALKPRINEPEALSQDRLSKLLVDSRAKFLKIATLFKDAATEYARKNYLVLDTESIEDVEAAKLFPLYDKMPMTLEQAQASVMSYYESHMEAIKAIVDADNQVPGAEASGSGGAMQMGWPAEAPGAGATPPRAPAPEGELRRVIEVKAVTAKTDTAKKTGKPYTKYGVCDTGSNWYNTFDKKIFDEATRLKGQRATIFFKQDKYGNTATHIEPA